MRVLFFFLLFARCISLRRFFVPGRQPRVSGGIHYKWFAVPPTPAAPQNANGKIRPPVRPSRERYVIPIVTARERNPSPATPTTADDYCPLLSHRRWRSVRNSTAVRVSHRLFHDAAAALRSFSDSLTRRPLVITHQFGRSRTLLPAAC